MDESMLRSVFDCLADGVAAARMDGTLVYFNPALVRLIGHGPLDVPPSEWASRYGAFRADGQTPLPQNELPMMRTLAGDSFDAYHVVIRNRQVPQGRHVEASGRPWRDPTGRQIGGVVVYRDTGAHVGDHQALQRDRAFLQSIVENVPAMIFVKDAQELRFERFNRAGEELLGQPREVLLGKNDYDFFPKDQADFFTQRDRETLAGRTVIDIPEEPIQTAAGLRWLHTKKVPVLDEQGNPKYLLGISLDITARKQAEDQLRQTHEELEQRVHERTAELERQKEDLRQEVAERIKAVEALRKSEAQLRQAQKMEAVGRLAGGVAHDFNNMLTAILSFARMMLDAAPEGDPNREDLTQIITAGERAAGLTRQLLAFSRQQVMQPVILDLDQVVRDMEPMLRRLIGEDIDLRAVLRHGDARVRADPGQLEQVLLNLVVNARDAMPAGGKLTIETSEVDLTGPAVATHPNVHAGKYLLLAVSDTGLGMSPEVLGHVFEPFFTTKPRGRGTGLGLSTCYGIVRQSGGDITVYSEPGLGSTFKIYLPAVLGAVEKAEARAQPRTAGGGGETVLVVEDELLVREAAVKVLKARGYHILVARDPGEALLVSASHAGTIDLLLTDVIMPAMNGRELAGRLTQERPGLRVLFMSGYTDNAIVHHGVLDKDVAFLPKPFTPESLERKVREVLDSVRVVPAG